MTLCNFMSAEWWMMILWNSIACNFNLWSILLFQLHTTDVGDGLDWNRLNLKSVTEENSLDEFLSTAELAGTEFSAGRLESAIWALYSRCFFYHMSA